MRSPVPSLRLLLRYERETSPFEQEIADLVRRIVSGSPVPDAPDGWLLVSRKTFGRYGADGNGREEEVTITYDYYLDGDGKFVLRKTVEKERSGRGTSSITDAKSATEECAASEVMRELDFDGYLSYSRGSGWHEHGWSLRYIASAGHACLNSGATLDIRRKNEKKGYGLLRKLKAVADGADTQTQDRERRSAEYPKEPVKGSARPGPQQEEPPVPPAEKNREPAPEKKKGPEEELQDVSAQLEAREGKIRGLRWTALLLLTAAFGSSVAVSDKTTLAWVPIAVCVISFALMAAVINAQANNGGGYVGMAVLIDVLLLFPLMVFGGMENWWKVFAAMMAFNLVYAIIWSAIFKGQDKAEEPLRNKKAELTKEAERSRKTLPRQREPMSEAGVMEYTAGMEEAYRELREKGGEIHTGFPWSAVYVPDVMRDILLARNTFVDGSNYERRREGIGRFRLSVDAYARYGVRPTKELTDYMRAWNLDSALDDARDWYVMMHPSVAQRK